MNGVFLSRSVRYLSIFAIMHYASETRSQAPGTNFPGPNDAELYRDRVNKALDSVMPLAKATEAISKKDMTGLEETVEGIKNLNNARAKAEQWMNNPQNADLPEVLSEAEASLSNKDQQFLAGLKKGNGSNCVEQATLVCNRSPSEENIVECSVARRDNTLTSGLRHLALVTVQCSVENKEVVSIYKSIFVGRLSSSIVKYGRVDFIGGSNVYTGMAYSSFCVPCAAESANISPTAPQKPKPKTQPNTNPH